MIKSKISEVAGRQHFTPAELAKEAKISWETAMRLWKSETKMISFNTLGELCRVLRCNPGDLLEYEPKNKSS